MPITRPEFVAISDDLYRRFSELLLERCGLRFPDNRRVELEHGIRQAFAASTYASLDEYYRVLRSPHENATVMHERLCCWVIVGAVILSSLTRCALMRGSKQAEMRFPTSFSLTTTNSAQHTGVEHVEADFGTAGAQRTVRPLAFKLAEPVFPLRGG